MATRSRAVRLFRPSLGKFVKDIDAVLAHARSVEDGSWVWQVAEFKQGKEEVLSEQAIVNEEGVLNEVYFPMGLKYAPDKVKGSGVAFAYWSLLVSALLFQNKDPESFLKRVAAWWGDSEFPTNPMPESEIGWLAIFGEKDGWFDARVAIFKELCSSEALKLIATAWTKKIKDARVFNLYDASNLAKSFPKSFADPFLFKAQRAIWLFTWPYRFNNKVKVVTELTPPALPNLLNKEEFLSSVEMHPVLKEKLLSNGFIRDEDAEQAVRAFIVLNADKTALGPVIRDFYEFSPLVKESYTTDY